MWGHFSAETHAEIVTFKKIRSTSKNKGKNYDNNCLLKYSEL